MEDLVTLKELDKENVRDDELLSFLKQSSPTKEYLNDKCEHNERRWNWLNSRIGDHRPIRCDLCKTTHCWILISKVDTPSRIETEWRCSTDFHEGILQTKHELKFRDAQEEVFRDRKRRKLNPQRTTTIRPSRGDIFPRLSFFEPEPKSLPKKKATRQCTQE